MPCLIRASALLAAGAFVSPAIVHADEPVVPLRATASPAVQGLVLPTLSAVAAPASGALDEVAGALTVAQRRRAARSAGPNIGQAGLGAVVGLTEFEIGPSFRYWVNERFGVQAHLGFGGDSDFIGEDVEYLRFEPTFIVAIGDFGNDALNVRPYAGGGLRVLRTDIGDFDDVSVRPAGVGGVEFGFRGAPRLKVSGELSVSGENDLDDFNFGNGPSIGGVRFSALAHYFFD